MTRYLLALFLCFIPTLSCFAVDTYTVPANVDNGTTNVTGSVVLGDAAFANRTSFATKAQGELGATALQPGDVAVSVKDYGAAGDTQKVVASDCAISASSADLACTTSYFTSADVGKKIRIDGAGASGGIYIGTVAAYSSGAAVTVSPAASATVSTAPIEWGTDDTAAFTATYAAAYAAGRSVYIPDGNYNLTQTDPGVGDMEFIGQSTAKTILTYHEMTDASPLSLWKNVLVTAKGTLRFRKFTIRGHRDTDPITNQGGNAVYLDGYKSLEFDSIRYEEINKMANDLHKNKEVTWHNCEGERIARDLYRARDSFAVTVDNCRARNIGDDVVAIHTVDYEIDGVAVVRQGVKITNNHFQDSAAIKVMGARVVDISHNLLERMLLRPIWVMTATDTEGGNAQYNIKVLNNTIIDSHWAWNASPLPSQGVIVIEGAAPTGTTASSDTVPGYVAADGTPIYTWDWNKVDYFDVASPKYHTIDVDVSGNTISRTQPAVANYSDWGYGPLVNSVGVVDPAVSDATMRPAYGILFRANAGFRRVRVTDNTISHTDMPVYFVNADNNTDLEQIMIKNNIFHDFIGGLTFSNTSSVSATQVEVSGNFFNGDPQRTYSNSNNNGTYTGQGNPTAIYGGALKSLTVKDNQFMNVCLMVSGSAKSTYTMDGNIGYAKVVAEGFSTSNAGIGNIEPVASGFSYISVESDPTQSTYLSHISTMVTTSAAMPTSGTYVKGWFVRNTTPAVVAGSPDYLLTGWQRLTTGTAHVLNTDWAELRSLVEDIPADVTGVAVSGTPVDNQIAVFTDSNTIAGLGALTFNDYQLGVYNNTTSPLLYIFTTPSAANLYPQVRVDYFANGFTGGFPSIGSRVYGGTSAAKTAVLSGVTLNKYQVNAYDGNSDEVVAELVFRATATQSDSTHATAMDIKLGNTSGGLSTVATITHDAISAAASVTSTTGQVTSTKSAVYTEAIGSTVNPRIEVKNSNGAAYDTKSEIHLVPTGGSTIPLAVIGSSYTSYTGTDNLGGDLYLATRKSTAAGGITKRVTIEETGALGLHNAATPSATADRVKLYNVEGDYIHIKDEDGNDHTIGQGAINVGDAAQSTVNASKLNGATFAAPGAIGGTTPGTGAFTSVTATGSVAAKTFTPTIPTAATDGATVTFDLSAGDSPSVELGGNRTLATSNVTAGQWWRLNLIQDGTGSRTVTWFSGISWRNTPSNAAPVLLTGAGKTDSFVCHNLTTSTYECWTAGNQ